MAQCDGVYRLRIAAYLKKGEPIYFFSLFSLAWFTFLVLVYIIHVVSIPGIILTIE